MTDAAANTTQTGQQSNSGADQSTSNTPPSGDGSQTTITRPDYVPEAYWDATTNAVKAQEFTTHIGELAALKAQHDARIAARPEKPEGYALKFSDTFKPEVAIAFDETDPRVAAVRTFAHELNLDQAGFSRLLEIEASHTVAETKAHNDAVAAETKKLGANATARVTALKTWLGGMLSPAAAADLLGDDKNPGWITYSAAAIEHLENLQRKFSSQGGGNYSGSGRENPPPAEKPLAQKLWPLRQAAS